MITSESAALLKRLLVVLGMWSLDMWGPICGLVRRVFL